MSYRSPYEFTDLMVSAGAEKTCASTTNTLIRAYMAGAILALSAAFAVSITTNTGEPLLGAVAFPAGFCLLYLMGFDLLTGVFTLVPLAYLARRPGVTVMSVLRTWGLVFLGNFAGALTTATMMAVYFTFGFSAPVSDVGEAIGQIGAGRTVGYAEHGAAGMLTLFLRGVMCNWMVSTGVVAAMMSTSLGGKVIAMWMPITIFFYLGFEHSVVNMFLFPVGLMLGGDFTITDYLIWNEGPTILGNLVGGLLFVGLPLYLTYGRRSRDTSTLEAEDTLTPFVQEVR